MARLVLLISFLALLFPAEASGKQNTALAKKYYRVGKMLYERADYEGALKNFRESYKLSNKPALLHNIARCYESLGKQEEAVVYYESYLRHKPEDADMIRERINNLRRHSARQNSKEQAPASLPVLTAASLPDSAEKKGLSAMKITGWSMVAAGGMLALSGIMFGIVANMRANELDEASARGEEYSRFADLESSGKTMERCQIVSLTTAGAALMIGTALLLADRSQAAESRSVPAKSKPPAIFDGASSAPSISLTGSGLVGSWQF